MFQRENRPRSKFSQFLYPLTPNVFNNSNSPLLARRTLLSDSLLLFSICFVNTSYCSPQLPLHTHTADTCALPNCSESCRWFTLSFSLYFLLGKFIHPRASMLHRCHNIQSYASSFKFSLDSDPWSQPLIRHVL